MLRPYFCSGIIILIALALAMSAEAGQSRFALVIGNEAYRKSPLTNPVNDARDMAAVLRTLDFEVLLRTDVNRRDMLETVQNFGKLLKDGDMALFYYSGHGLQSQNENYLLPLHANISGEADIEYEAVNAHRILGHLEETNPHGVKIVILDACRNNPYKGFLKGGSDGLAEMTGLTNSLIAYATAANTAAYGNLDERNSHYTRHLLESLKESSQKRILDIFTAVVGKVAKASNYAQVPWLALSLTDPETYFLDPAPEEPVPPQTSAPGSFQEYTLDGIRDIVLRDGYHWPAEGIRGTVRHQYEQHVLSGEKVILDRARGLMWQQSGSAEAMSWSQTSQYVQALNTQKFAGFSDWRLPTFEELLSLLEATPVNQGELFIHSFFDVTQAFCWSGNPDLGGEAVWIVIFTNDGNIYPDDLDSAENYVRAVRSVQ